MLPTTPRSAYRETLDLARTFRRDEDGSLIAFSLFIFFCMILFGGIAVDLMIYENERTHVQNSTDRAVLAAANLNQTVDPKEVVKDYLAKVNITVTDDDIDVFEVGAAPVITGRQVSVDVSGGYQTLLMKLVGVETLPFATTSQAEESVSDVEVSLVLDVSGSMGDNNKLANMQDAATHFVDNILAGAEDDRVSLSLVPYSTQVNAGPLLFSSLTTHHNHNYSHCVNFAPEDFAQNSLQRSRQARDQYGNLRYTNGGEPVMEPISLSQTAHFDPWRSYQSGMSVSMPVCRTESFSQITPWSNDPVALRTQIESFTAEGNTSIDVAVKWGVALLDPSTNGALNTFTGAGRVDNAFSVRPHAYGRQDSLKFIVVMTDGINTDQFYLRDSFEEGSSPYYKNNSSNDIYWEREEPSDRDRDSRYREDWYNITDKNWTNSPGTLTRLSWLDAWANMTLQRRAYAYYHFTGNNSDFYDNYYDPYRTVPARSTNASTDTKDRRLSQICSAAKAQNIVIFTIGFEVTDESAEIMRNCASTDQHFYRVEGLDIEFAFSSIANQINQLKLTQ